MTPLLHAQEWGGGFQRIFQMEGPPAIGYGLGSRMGNDIDVIGDVNGDGISDIVVGAPFADDMYGLASGGLVEVHSGVDGSLLFSNIGSTQAYIGETVSGVGDINYDGIPDYAFSTRSSVEIRSGAHGHLLRTIFPLFGDSFRWGLERAGDLDGDGIEDMLIYGYRVQAGATVYAYSGATGLLIWSQTGPNETPLFNSLASIPDLNGDGIRDCISGGETLHLGAKVIVHSGADGSSLHTWSDPTSLLSFGKSVASVGDYDGDRMPDLAIGNPSANSGASYLGEVQVYSSATFGLIRTFLSDDGYAGVGVSVSNAGDVDEDGIEDLATTTRGFPYQVAIFSGQTGDRLCSVSLNFNGQGPSSVVKGLGDLNHDGKLNLLVSCPYAGTPHKGEVYLYSFSDFMDSDKPSISAASGGKVKFNLFFPRDNHHWTGTSTMRYRMLFSASGTGPTELFGWNIPLSADHFWQVGISGNYPRIIVPPKGTFGADGTAVVTVNFPPGLATPLVGRTMHFSALQYEVPAFTDSVLHGSSRAVALDILP